MSQDGYRLLSCVTRTARKPHRCIWCGEAIETGAKYIDERSVYDGRMQRHRWHPECLPACHAALREAGDEGFTAHENERPKIPEASHA